MALSSQTLDHLLEAESHLRAAVKSAASNEKVVVIHQISKILVELEQIKKIDQIIDMLDHRKPGDSGSWGAFFKDDE